MARGAKYRLMAVDHPGYMGDQKTFAGKTGKEDALKRAEEFVRANAPRIPASFADPNQRAYVLVEKIYGNGDTLPVARWEDDRRGGWKKTRNNPSAGSHMSTRSEALSIEKEILDGITWAYWSNIYINQQEEKSERTGKPTPWRGGESIDPYIPKKIPAYVKAGAKEFAAILKHENRTVLAGLYGMAERANGGLSHREKDGPFGFGYYLAMQGMGHGVSWFDDHEEFDIKIPNYEVYGR